MANRPEPEVAVTRQLVTSLLADQFPELLGLTIEPLSRGWDNTNLLVGTDLIARIPHRQAAAELITNEQRWLPTLAPLLNMAIPTPSHAGKPTDFFPWPWSVTPFAAGAEAAGVDLKEPVASAEMLGTFFRQLHRAAPADAPVNPYRGVPLRDRTAAFEARVSSLEPGQDLDAIRGVFVTALESEPSPDRVWLHGDLHARNMIVADGRLTSVIDWGDICAGDRATDLAGAFMLVPDHVDVVADHAQASKADWQRARGWAANFAVIYLAHSDDDPVMGQIGTRLIATLLRDER